MLVGGPIIDNKEFLKKKGYEDNSEISVCIEIFLNVYDLLNGASATEELLEAFVNIYQNLNENEQNDLCEYIKKEENANNKKNPDSLKKRFCVYLNRYKESFTIYEVKKKQFIGEIMKKISSANI